MHDKKRQSGLGWNVVLAGSAIVVAATLCGCYLDTGAEPSDEDIAVTCEALGADSGEAVSQICGDGENSSQSSR